METCESDIWRTYYTFAKGVLTLHISNYLIINSSHIVSKALFDMARNKKQANDEKEMTLSPPKLANKNTTK